MASRPSTPIRVDLGGVCGRLDVGTGYRGRGRAALETGAGVGSGEIAKRRGVRGAFAFTPLLPANFRASIWRRSAGWPGNRPCCRHHRPIKPNCDCGDEAIWQFENRSTFPRGRPNDGSSNVPIEPGCYLPQLAAGVHRHAGEAETLVYLRIFSGAVSHNGIVTFEVLGKDIRVQDLLGNHLERRHRFSRAVSFLVSGGYNFVEQRGVRAAAEHAEVLVKYLKAPGFPFLVFGRM